MNVDWDWQARITGKTLTLPKHEDVKLNSITQTIEKRISLVFNRAHFGMVGRCHSIPCFYFLFFCSDTTEKKNTSERTISVTIMVIISKVPLWSLLEGYYVPSSFSTIKRHIDNGIWKILYRWRFYGHRSTYMLNLSWVNIVKWKWAKAPGKLSVAKKSEPALWRTLHQDIALINALFFASQKNRVF